MEELFGNSEAMQKQLTEALSKVKIQETLDGIAIEATGNREITNIAIPADLMNPSEKERLEDSLTVLMNRTLASITVAEQQASAKMMEDLLPGLGNLFGK
ncbi:MAG: YbaB/EbfC family nucleoid-associated protein [Saprospiraceae bacterium]|nr:YbaB/EbfC family nucleoid-associated protein [Saprospiraceae bacterium]MBK7222984.1 YbaB/EbfC family nucleoid-associated protein [Saprospiraceae bacterium]MBK8112666.1 YbaB/EbfC family nucleoid-associated protein [Saprospiraceae bacterium]MBK8852236.1 YbaB/EbfC family nucleoid-associated protein [Saprospiraceae bacterium]MBL0083066.1 YbaB/EbfC family nucleoid-associated protein [Saprospiraceae bacterium]